MNPVADFARCTDPSMWMLAAAVFAVVYLLHRAGWMR